jgi:hypothetical protein
MLDSLYISFLLLLLIIWHLSSIFAWLRSCNTKRSLERLNRPSQYLSALVTLCVLSYIELPACQSAFDSNDWRFVCCAEAGGIRLWRHKSGRRKWAVVLRGTSSVQDLASCYRLLYDSAFDATSRRWEQDTDFILDRVAALLKDAGIDPTVDNITFAGHSLGAAYAEFLLHHFRQLTKASVKAAFAHGLLSYLCRKFWHGVAVHDAVTIDSPGQPAQFRRAKGMPETLAGLITLNGPANPINLLNAPLAERLFCCQGGNTIAQLVVRPLTTVFHLAMRHYADFAGNVAESLEGHRVHNIERHLRSSRVTSTSRQAWARICWSHLALHAAQDARDIARECSKVRDALFAHMVPAAAQPANNGSRLAGAGAAVLTWLPGLAGWGALAGPSVLVGGAVGSIAVVPVAVVGGSGYVSYRYAPPLVRSGWQRLRGPAHRRRPAGAP